MFHDVFHQNGICADSAGVKTHELHLLDNLWKSNIKSKWREQEHSLHAMFQVRCVQGAWPLENKYFTHQSSPSRRDLIWWEWGVCKCTSVQKEHQDECLSWPYRQQLSTTTTTHNIMSFKQETITNSIGRAFGWLTLLFGFRWHGHVVEFIHKPHAVNIKTKVWGWSSTHLSSLTNQKVTYKLSIMGVEVHGLCVSL